MARTISDEEIKLSIIINGNPAQKQLIDIEKATRKLTEEKKSLQIELRRVERELGKESEEYKKLNASIKANTTEIENNKAKMQALRSQIGITGLTLNQLRDEANRLRFTLRNITPGSAEFKKFEAELQAVNARLAEVSGRAQQTRSSIGSIADGFNRYQALAFSILAVFTGVVVSIQKVLDYNGKLSESQADVMKTTGMTRKEVDELTKSFGLLKTRTARIDLLEIAEQGGRIGIVKEEIGSFVAVMDKANVALGDSFTGGVEEVANKLGKLKFLFQETKDMSVDKAYNSIGSAINDLGANGVASEANIAEFTTRMGSLTDVLKPTIAETLALGAAFEESGIEAEVSSRAYNIFMKQASTEASKFAQVMNLTKGEVEELINANPLEFMLKFAEGMRGMDATETAKTLDFLGVNADGANKVIGAMGNNMGRFRELIDLSNDSFDKGTSLVKEYNIKNETLGATLDKIKKTVTGWFSSDTFVKWLTVAVAFMAKLIGATEDADGTVSKWRTTLVNLIKIITVATVGFLSYNTALKLVALWTNGLTSATTLMNVAQKANALTGGVLKAVYLGLSYVYYELTLQTERAAVAQKAFALATKTNPIGLVVGLLAALATAYVVFNKQVAESTKLEKNLNDVRTEATKSIADEKSNLESLLSIAKNEELSKETREAAIRKINEISPEYLGNITLETLLTNKSTEAINKYLVALDNKAMKEAFAAKRSELSKKVIDARSGKSEGSDEDLSKFGGNFWYTQVEDFQKAFEEEIKNEEQFKKRAKGWNSFKLNAYREYKMSIKLAKTELEALAAEEQKFIDKNATLYVDPNAPVVDSNFTVPTTGDKESGAEKNPNSSAEEIRRLNFEDEQKWATMSLKLKRQLEDDKIAAMTDGYKKEVALEQLRYERQIEDYERQKVNAEQMSKLDEEIAKAQEEKDSTKEAALHKIKQHWIDRNHKLDALISQIQLNEKSIHYYKLATIEEKAATAAIEKKKQDFENEKVIRETAFNEQYAALGENQKAKDKLKREFEANELKLQEDFLKELILEYNTVLSQGNFEGIDLSLLTPEALEKFKQDVEKVKKLLSELGLKKQELKAADSASNAQALGINNNTDIFGFSSENWMAFFDNLKTGTEGINTMVFAVQALTNMWGKYSQYLAAGENANLKKYEQTNDRKKRRLKQSLDAGAINQEQYNKLVEKLDADLDKKKAQLAHKQAKRERAIAIASAITGTAQAVIGALGNKPWTPFNFALAGIVGAMGLLQVATILRTPLPSATGYEKGLYPEYVKREQDGKVFRSSGTSPMRSGLYSKPRILVGEGPGDMPEMVIDKRAFAQISPATKNALIGELRGIKGFENGMYNQSSMRYEVPAAPSSDNSAALMLLVEQNTAVMAENVAVMRDLRDKGVIGKFLKRDYESVKNIDDAIKEYQEIKSKNKL